MPKPRSFTFWTSLVLVAAAWAAAGAGAAPPLLDHPLHLGWEGSPEWESFKGRRPDARRLDLPFVSASNQHQATLWIRQDDVKQEWPLELNGKRLGKLFLMEADLVQTLPIAPGLLRDGTNLLSIIPPRDLDDIVLHEIRIDPRPVADVVQEAMLAAEVRDADGGVLLPARLTVVDGSGTLCPLSALSNSPPAAVRPGVAYIGNGRLQVGLPAGRYTVFASRGFEWSVATQQVRVTAGGVARLSFRLRREVPTPGWVSCDTHVHTFTHSGHGDATLDERMLTLAGEGLELPVATDHNVQVDYAEAAARLGVVRWFTPVTGNEVTTPAGHFNVFPVRPEATPPDFQVTDWSVLMQALRATPGVRVVVLNHPRNIHAGFQPFAATNFNAVTGDNLRGPEFSFDAMEVLNSSAQQTDYLLVYRDWFALLNHGYRVTGVGSSDGHDVSRYIVGQGRTYVACPDADPAHLDVALACSNLVAGRALVSMGLLATMTVNERFSVGDLVTQPDAELRVQVTVLGPSWVTATNVALFANGTLVREAALDPGTHSLSASPPGVKGVVRWSIPWPAHDVYLVALATGPGVTAPFWALPRPYQPVSPRWTSRVIGSTNPIWIDGDRDGHFTAARGYAQELLGRCGVNPRELLPALGRFDEAVAAQAATLCTAAGADLRSEPFTLALQTATAPVRAGFAAFRATLGR